MFGLAPLVNPSSVVPRLHLRNESTDLNITLTIYNYKPLFYVHFGVSQVSTNMLKTDT